MEFAQTLSSLEPTANAHMLFGVPSAHRSVEGSLFKCIEDSLERSECAGGRKAGCKQPSPLPSMFQLTLPVLWLPTGCPQL